MFAVFRNNVVGNVVKPSPYFVKNKNEKKRKKKMKRKVRRKNNNYKLISNLTIELTL